MENEPLGDLEGAGLATHFRQHGLVPRDVLVLVAIVVLIVFTLAVYAPSWLLLGDEELDARGNVLSAFFSETPRWTPPRIAPKGRNRSARGNAPGNRRTPGKKP